MKMNRLGFGLGLLALTLATGARAQPAGEPSGLPVIGVPVPGGVGYQPAVTPVGARHALAVAHGARDHGRRSCCSSWR